jgi:hypothetical protein
LDSSELSHDGRHDEAFEDMPGEPPIPGEEAYVAKAVASRRWDRLLVNAKESIFQGVVPADPAEKLGFTEAVRRPHPPRRITYRRRAAGHRTGRPTI